CSFLQKGISMLSTPIFTRLLTTSEYGKYSVFNTWLGILSIIIALHLCYGVFTQGLVKFEEDRNVFCSSMQGLSSALILAWTVVYFVFRDFWNHLFSLTTVQMLSMLIMIWATEVFGFWAAEQRVEYKYKALVAITLVVSLAKPLVGILFVVLAEDKVTARILGLVLVELVGYSGLFAIQIKRGKKLYSPKYWKYALAFNIPLLPHYLSQIVLSSADRIMISNMIGNSEAGIYSLAYSLSSIMQLFNSALMQTLSPWIYQKIKANRIKDIESVAYTTLLIIASVNLVLILLAPEAVALFAPKTYREAIYIIPPVAMSVFFMYSYDLFAKFAFYYEKTKLIMTASTIGAALNVFLNLYFIRKFGYIAAGYTTLACYIIYCVAHYNLMNWLCKTYCEGTTPYDTKKILGISVIFLVSGFAFLITYYHPVIRYVIIIIAIFSVFFVRKKLMKIGKMLLATKKNKN
ncbi:MAG: lipopolysaccharide biosynthesis protein, partial [Faecousia sp.]